jgi:hypothetical protein
MNANCDVYFVEDLVALLGVSLRTIHRKRRHGVFPIPELPTVDSRPRWSRAVVRRFLDGEQVVPQQRVRLHARESNRSARPFPVPNADGAR